MDAGARASVTHRSCIRTVKPHSLHKTVGAHLAMSTQRASGNRVGGSFIQIGGMTFSSMANRLAARFGDGAVTITSGDGTVIHTCRATRTCPVAIVGVKSFRAQTDHAKVHVEGSDGAQTKLELTITVTAQTQEEADRRADALLAHGVHVFDHESGELSVPRRVEDDVVRVEISATLGATCESVDVETEYGSIELSDFKGTRVDLRASNDSIEVADVRCAESFLKSSYGKISIARSEFTANLRAVTSNDDIRLDNVRFHGSLETSFAAVDVHDCTLTGVTSVKSRNGSASVQFTKAVRDLRVETTYARAELLECTAEGRTWLLSRNGEVRANKCEFSDALEVETCYDSAVVSTCKLRGRTKVTSRNGKASVTNCEVRAALDVETSYDDAIVVATNAVRGTTWSHHGTARNGAEGNARRTELPLVTVRSRSGNATLRCGS